MSNVIYYVFLLISLIFIVYFSYIFYTQKVGSFQLLISIITFFINLNEIKNNK